MHSTKLTQILNTPSTKSTTDLSNNIRDVSIVLPTYEGFPLIKRAVKSIVNQTLPNWELIIINDGSKDRFLKHYLNKLPGYDKRIRVKTLEENKGLPNALNEGLKESNCKYWTWISDDNEFLPDALSSMKKRLDEGFSFVYSDYIFKNEIERVKVTIRAEYSSIKELMYEWRGMACYMWRTSTIKKIGYFRDLQGVEDYDYVLRTFIFLPSDRICHESRILMIYYRHSDTLSVKMKNSIENMRLELFEKYNSLITQ